MLLIGIVPQVYAAEVTEPTTANQAGGTEPPPSAEPTEPTEPTSAVEETDPTADPTEPTEPTDPQEEPTEIPDEPELLAEDGIMLASSTTGNVTLFDQAKPDYTVRLSSQLLVTYRPNGTGSSVTAKHKNLGWHFARYGGTSYPDDPIYCIEPHKEFAASTPGNYVDNGVTVDGSGGGRGSDVWYDLPADSREAIALILLYSDRLWNDSYSVLSTPKADNPNVPVKVATQFLIYEIVTGLRDGSTFTRNSSNGYTDGDAYYNAGVANVSGFAQAYNSIVDSVQAAMKIPSFTGKDSGSAPTITLTGDETVVTDSNGVLSNFQFTDGSGASFRKSGNSLYITQTGNIFDSTVFSCSRDLPSAQDSSVSIWYGSTSKYQACVSLYSPSTGSLNAYFKLKAPAKGNISLTKTTEDGKNLSGWKFGIYSDSACSSLVTGPHTTDSSGKISVTDLPAGTYYVKELGHSDSNINALYTCASANPQKVTVTSGGTAAVKFHNKLNTGDIRIAKSTNTGKNLSGWQIGIYTDANCTKPISGSPFITGADGVVTVEGLLPGTYYAKEVASSDPYWECDGEIRIVTVSVGKTASVIFRNTHRGRAKLIKTMPDGGRAAGWKFEVSSSDGKVAGTYITGKDGTVLTDYLLPGKYTVKELLPEDSPYRCESANPQTVTIQAGQTAEVTFSNRLKPGEILVKKVDTKGNPLAGAEFLLEWSADGTSWKPVAFTDAPNVTDGTCTAFGLTDGKLTSGEDGILRFTGLHPLRQYRLTETKAPEGHQLLAEPAYEGSIPAENDFTVQLTVVNAPTYELPKTGSTGSAVLRIAQIATAAVLLVMLICHIKKRR